MEIPGRSGPLCRPKLLPDEWIETYLFRVARANGVPRPKITDIERFRPTLEVTAGSKPQGYPVWGDAALPQWSVVTRANKIRYCPACMVESRHIRSRWRLTMLEVCTLHHIRLKDNLAEPVMTQGYMQEGRHLITDITEEQLWAGATCPMPSERRHVTRLWADFEQLILDDNAQVAFERLTYILLMEALLDALDTVTPESESLPLGTSRSTRLATLVERHQFSMSVDSDGVREFLDQIIEPAHRSVVLARLRRMLLDEAYKPTCLSRLPIANFRRRFFVEGLETISAPIRGGLPANHEISVGYVSFEKAAQRIGCPQDLLRHLVQSNILKSAGAIQHKRKRYAYLLPQVVEACRRWFASIATREQAMAQLHVAQRGYVALVGAGLLRPLAFDRRPYFRQSDLADLCRRFEEVSQPCPADISHLQSLFGEWLPCRGRYRRTSPDMLKEALNGSFPVFRRLENPGLSAYFVDWKAIDRLHRFRRTEAAGHALQVGVPQQLSLLPE